MNLDAIRLRARIVSAIRSFFDGRDFVEVETPVRIAAPAPEPNIDCPEVLPPRNFWRRTDISAGISGVADEEASCGWDGAHIPDRAMFP